MPSVMVPSHKASGCGEIEKESRRFFVVRFWTAASAAEPSDAAGLDLAARLASQASKDEPLGSELMAIAFTFPGQGSQAVGMGKDLADAFPEARAVFEEVDDALGEKLSGLIWEGPEETLTLTANAQPALMAVSLAAIRALEARGFSLKDKVAYVAGHSLGEYSALAAAGIVLARRYGAAAAHPRQCHAGGGAGRRGRHGGDHRAGTGRRRSRLRRGGERLGLPDRQRQWRRPAGDFRRQGRGRTGGAGCAPKRAPSAR